MKKALFLMLTLALLSLSVSAQTNKKNPKNQKNKKTGNKEVQTNENSGNQQSEQANWLAYNVGEDTTTTSEDTGTGKDREFNANPFFVYYKTASVLHGVISMDIDSIVGAKGKPVGTMKINSDVLILTEAEHFKTDSINTKITKPIIDLWYGVRKTGIDRNTGKIYISVCPVFVLKNLKEFRDDSLAMERIILSGNKKVGKNSSQSKGKNKKGSKQDIKPEESIGEKYLAAKKQETIQAGAVMKFFMDRIKETLKKRIATETRNAFYSNFIVKIEEPKEMLSSGMFDDMIFIKK